MSLFDDGVGFTFIWNIENFSYCCQKGDETLNSPEFVTKTCFRSSKWFLGLVFRRDENNVYISLCRSTHDDGPSRIKVRYAIDLLTSLTSEDSPELDDPKTEVFCHNQGAEPWEFEDVLNSGLLFNGTLTVCLRMCNKSLEATEPQLCFGRTRIGLKRMTFISSIDDISSIKLHHTRKIPIKLISEGKFQLAMTLFMTHGSNMYIRVHLTDTNHPKYITSTIAIVNTTGSTTISDEYNHWVETSAPEQVWNHTICLHKGQLMSNKNLYLPNDTLYLQCEIGIVYGIQINEIEDVDEGPCYAYDCNQIHSDENKQPFYFNKEPSDSKLASLDESTDYQNHVPSEPSSAPDFKQLHSADTEQTTHLEVSSDSKSACSALLHDLQCAFKERVLCDVNLRTDSETFSVHRFILSARSTVFKAMFSSNMKEKASDCVDIPDLDAGTIRHMLTYMYTDIVEDLDIDPASKLYFAADKYDIVSLKEKCSSLLKAKLSESKACDVLVLADMHQDSDLKAAVQDFILKKDKEILRSKEWKDFQKNHLELANETLLLVYLKKLES